MVTGPTVESAFFEVEKGLIAVGEALIEVKAGLGALKEVLERDAGHSIAPKRGRRARCRAAHGTIDPLDCSMSRFSGEVRRLSSSTRSTRLLDNGSLEADKNPEDPDKSLLMLHKGALIPDEEGLMPHPTASIEGHDARHRGQGSP